jgi:hypothetical protein
LVTPKRSFITEDKDILDIYDGNDDGVLLGSFYGYYPVENLAPVVSYSGKMRLVFTSDATMQRQGFRVQYESSTVICIQICTNFNQATCPNSCSGHGVCNFGSCICDIGWEGLACNQSKLFNIFANVTGFCSNNCWNHGDCVDGQCTCNSGYLGVDCRISTNLHNCLHVPNITASEGTVAFIYYPSDPCTFFISNPSAGSISMRFDFYNITEGTRFTVHSC